MKEAIIYIPAGSEEYTGFTTSVMSTTSTSDLMTMYIESKIGSPSNLSKEEEKGEDLKEKLGFFEK